MGIGSAISLGTPLRGEFGNAFERGFNHGQQVSLKRDQLSGQRAEADKKRKDRATKMGSYITKVPYYEDKALGEKAHEYAKQSFTDLMTAQLDGDQILAESIKMDMSNKFNDFKREDAEIKTVRDNSHWAPYYFGAKDIKDANGTEMPGIQNVINHQSHYRMVPEWQNGGNSFVPVKHINVGLDAAKDAERLSVGSYIDKGVKGGHRILELDINGKGFDSDAKRLATEKYDTDIGRNFEATMDHDPRFQKAFDELQTKTQQPLTDIDKRNIIIDTYKNDIKGYAIAKEKREAIARPKSELDYSNNGIGDVQTLTKMIPRTVSGKSVNDEITGNGYSFTPSVVDIQTPSILINSEDGLQEKEGGVRKISIGEVQVVPVITKDYKSIRGDIKKGSVVHDKIMNNPEELAALKKNGLIKYEVLAYGNEKKGTAETSYYTPVENVEGRLTQMTKDKSAQMKNRIKTLKVERDKLNSGLSVSTSTVPAQSKPATKTTKKVFTGVPKEGFN